MLIYTPVLLCSLSTSFPSIMQFTATGRAGRLGLGVLWPVAETSRRGIDSAPIHRPSLEGTLAWVTWMKKENVVNLVVQVGIKLLCFYTVFICHYLHMLPCNHPAESSFKIHCHWLPFKRNQKCKLTAYSQQPHSCTVFFFSIKITSELLMEKFFMGKPIWLWSLPQQWSRWFLWLNEYLIDIGAGIHFKFQSKCRDSVMGSIYGYHYWIKHLKNETTFLRLYPCPPN